MPGSGKVGGGKSVSRKDTVGVIAMNDEPRYITLLRAAHTLLKKQYDANCVLNLLDETVHYDGVKCDGNCLLNDIEYYFDEIGVAMPESERISP
jgi:hypothetical protein